MKKKRPTSSTLTLRDARIPSATMFEPQNRWMKYMYSVQLHLQFYLVVYCVHCTMLFLIFLLGFIVLFIQYYSVICRPSDHTVGRPRAENRTLGTRFEPGIYNV